MTEAEKAYAAAEAAIASLIAKQKENPESEDSLRFEGRNFINLRKIPPSILEIPSLKRLAFYQVPISDDGILILQSRIDLETLGFIKTNVSDDGVKFFSSLPQLKHIRLGDSPISDAGVAEICKLPDLQSLSLDGTQISDESLIHLGRTEKIEHLWLNNTDVLDLRPLRSLNSLARYGFGLNFKNTAATRSDPRIAEIAEIEDAAERARTLFDYLKDWEPPRTKPPEDTPLAPVYILPDDGPVQSQDIHPESGDEDQLFLQDDLRRKTRQLIETIGGSNELADLRTSAEHYEAQLSRDLADIRLKLLYSAANTLRVAYEADALAEETGRINDQLPPKIGATLKDLVETHGLFYSGFPNAAEIHQQMLSGLTGQRDAEQLQLAERIVEALRDKPDALAPEDQAAMADDLAAAKGQGPSAEIGEKSLRARLWNMFGAVGRRVYKAGKKGLDAILKHDFIAFLKGSPTLIESWIVSAQGSTIGQWIKFLFEFLKGG